MKKKELVDCVKTMNKQLAELVEEMWPRESYTSVFDRVMKGAWSSSTEYEEEKKSEVAKLSERLGGWNSEELDTLDRKLDALCDLLSVEFVDEKTTVGGGSDTADETIERFYARKIKKTKKSKK